MLEVKSRVFSCWETPYQKAIVRPSLFENMDSRKHPCDLDFISLRQCWLRASLASFLAKGQCCLLGVQRNME